MKTPLVLLSLSLILLPGCSAPADGPSVAAPAVGESYASSRPHTRWWWFASRIDERDIETQLDWLKDNHFGGVEIAWIYPPGRDPAAPRFPWLGEDWSRIVAHTKEYADSIGLQCDFTFGTLWPFGAAFVPDSDRTRVHGDPGFKQDLRLSWDHPLVGNVINHLDRGAFERYARRMTAALKKALDGSTSALFCDSWEVETRRIWTDGFEKIFEARFGYDIRPFMAEIYSDARCDERYDYMKLVSELVIDNFYRPFTEVCHAEGAISRVQCAGSPTDLITAYASVDVPETEAMLFEPSFSRIPASAAVLAGAPLVSAETFTCLYGFPGQHLGEERAGDLKLVADALFANGVNQIIWHGMPFNGIGRDSNRFYATVHVGRHGALAPELPAFNRYMAKVSRFMRTGRTYSDVAVYLPLEDGWIAGEYPEEKQFPWVWGAYELRYLQMPEELKGYHPLWINETFLEKGVLREGKLHCGDACFSSLYVDVDNLDSDALDKIVELAEMGLPVCLRRRPREPGRIKSDDYGERLDRLESLENVSSLFSDVTVRPPLVSGDDLPDYWCRVAGDRSLLFFAHPRARNLSLPLPYGLEEEAGTAERTVVLRVNGRSREVKLEFGFLQSLLLEVDSSGRITFQDIGYLPRERGE